MEQASGYMSPLYAAALAEFGTPVELPRCGGRLLIRSIPGSPYKDAMGCYPLFSCRDGSELQRDLEELDSEIVSVSLVADPFMNITSEQLEACFPDRLISFKKHYVLQLNCRPEGVVRKRALRYAAAALRTLEFEICPDPASLLDEWMRLYGCLIQRHGLQGIHEFSRASFVAQMRTPGLIMTRAIHQGRTVGMLSWYRQQNAAYAHLIGLDEEGYELRAAYALYWASICYFVGKVAWLDLGGVPGHSDSDSHGLAQFKQGWASETRTAFFCGRILRPEKYAQLVRNAGLQNNDYFPAYRQAAGC